MAAIDDIRAGTRRFREKVFPGLKISSSGPKILFIGCADSPIDPHQLTQSKPGSLMIVNNPANLVPTWGGDASTGGEAAAIEFAVSVLKVKNIIVCGHSACASIAALLGDTETASQSAVKSWLDKASATRRIIEESNESMTREARLLEAAGHNVLSQLAALKTHPGIAAGLAKDTLQIHGWVYQRETGDVLEADDAGKGFRCITSDGPSRSAARSEFDFSTDDEITPPKKAAATPVDDDVPVLEAADEAEFEPEPEEPKPSASEDFPLI